MNYKEINNYTKEELDRIRECAPVVGTKYTCKCNKCGNILSVDDCQCDVCGSYDVVDMNN